MPVSIPYTATQSVDSVSLTFTLPSSSSSVASLDVLVTPLLVKISAPPCLLLVDLLQEVLPASRRLRRLTGGRQAVLELRKREEGEWPALVWSGDKATREARRRLSLQQWEEEQRSAAAAAKETRKAERKEGRERGWDAERQRQQAIDTLKTRERVVAVEELQAWSRQREEKEPLTTLSEEKTALPASAAALRRSLPPPPASAPSSPPLPPVRPAVRLTASFTSVHPALPSLPARCPLPAEPAPAAASLSASASSLLPNVLALKERADSCYGKRELLSALSGYSSALEALRGLRQLEMGGSEDRQRLRLLEGKLLSNRSACWFERSRRAAGLEALRKAEQDALEAMRLLDHCGQQARKEAADAGAERETERETERQQLLRKLRRRLAAVNSAMGRWDDALQQMTEDDCGREEAARKAEAVRAGEDSRETEEALRCLRCRPPLLGAALRHLSSALALRPLSLQALELRLSVSVSLRRWTDGLRDAATALSLCDADGELEAGQKIRVIARRGECLYALQRYAEAKADIALVLATPAALTASASTASCPSVLSPSATALSALLAAADTEAELAAVLASIRSLFSSLPAVPCPATSSSSPAAPLAVLAAHFRTALLLQSQLQPSQADERWLLSRCELVSDAAWLSCIDGSAAAAAERQTGREGLQRALDMWQHWREDGRQQQQEEEADWPQQADDAGASEERQRRADDRQAERAALQVRERRWLLLCTLRLSTVCCWQGELQRGREGYVQVQRMLKAATAGREESEQEGRERQQLEADTASIERSIAAAATACD